MKFIYDICFGEAHKFTNGERVKFGGDLNDTLGFYPDFYEFDSVTGNYIRYRPNPNVGGEHTTTSSPTTTPTPTTAAPTTTLSPGTTTAPTTTTTLGPDQGEGYFVNTVSCNCITIHKTKVDALKGENVLVLNINEDVDKSLKGHIYSFPPWDHFQTGGAPTGGRNSDYWYREDCNGNYRYHTKAELKDSTGDFCLIEDNAWIGSLGKIEPSYEIGDVIYVRPLKDQIKVKKEYGTESGTADFSGTGEVTWENNSDSHLDGLVCGQKNMFLDLDCGLGISGGVTGGAGNDNSDGTSGNPGGPNPETLPPGTTIAPTTTATCSWPATVQGGSYTCNWDSVSEVGTFVFNVASNSVSCWGNSTSHPSGLSVSVTYEIPGGTTETSSGTATISGQTVTVTYNSTTGINPCLYNSSSISIDCTDSNCPNTATTTTTTTSGPTTTSSVTTTTGYPPDSKRNNLISRGVIYFEDINVIGRKRVHPSCGGLSSPFDQTGPNSTSGNQGYQGYQGQDGAAAHRGLSRLPR